MKTALIILICFLVLGVGLGVYYNLQKEEPFVPVDYIKERTGLTQEQFTDFQIKQSEELQKTGFADDGKTRLLN